jgi:hypothetical protein
VLVGQRDVKPPLTLCGGQGFPTGRIMSPSASALLLQFAGLEVCVAGTSSAFRVPASMLS